MVTRIALRKSLCGIASPKSKNSREKFTKDIGHLGDLMVNECLSVLALNNFLKSVSKLYCFNIATFDFIHYERARLYAPIH